MVADREETASLAAARARQAGCRRTAGAIGVGTLVAGLAVLAGWVFDVPALTTLLPGLVSMKANTALSLAFLGLAINRSRQESPLTTVFAAITALIGALSLIENAFSVDLGIDEVLFREDAGAVRTSSPGRMALTTALALTCLATGVTLLRRPRLHAFVLMLGGVSGVLAWLALVGYVYGDSALFAPFGRSAMALHTAILLTSLSLALHLMLPERGLVGLVTEASVAGSTSRILLPVAVLVPFAVGWLRIEGEGAGLYGFREGVSFMALTLSALLIATTWFMAQALRRIDSERARAASALAQSSEVLESVFANVHTMLAVLDREFNFIRVNPAYAGANDQTPGFFTGKNHFALYPNEENEAIFRGVVESGETYHAYARPFVSPDQPERGTTYWNWDLTPIKDEGRVTGVVLSLVDVTERERATQALRGAALYSRGLLEASLDPLVTISPAGKVTDVNVATEQATGLPREKLVGTDFADYFTEPEMAREGYHRVLSEGLVRDYPLTLRHASGATRDVLYNATVYRNEAGEVEGVFAAARDITARKVVEEALRASEAKLRRLVESNLIGVAFWTTEGGIREGNDEFARIAGVKREDLATVNWRDITPPEHREKDNEALRQIAERGVCEPYEKEYVLAAGRRVPILVASASLPGSADEGLAFVLDLTERKRAQDAMRAAALYARGLIEASLDPLVTISPEGKITDVNAATEQATGIDRHSLIGTDFADYFTEPEMAREGYRRVLSEGLVRDYPLTLTHASERTVDVLYNATVYRNEDGQVQGVFAAARDVTERKAAEEALRVSEAELRKAVADLERSNGDLEQFAYVASHDLQEPLRMVSNYTQLLARRYAGRLDADADDFINFAVDGATRMQALIEDLLQYSRVGTRGKPLAVTDSTAVLERALRGLTLAIEDSGATVTSDPLPTVMADDIQLERVLRNLVENAMKFRSVEPPRIHVSAAEQEDGMWRFSVHDNGLGIDAQYHERIFVIFQRLHGRGEYPGSGIGLAISRRIVERHGGRIWVESEAGKGSTFYFTMPATPRRTRVGAVHNGKETSR